MNGTTTRARTGRAAAGVRRGARPQAHHNGTSGAPVDGANALRIGYDDPAELLVPPSTEPRRRTRPRITPSIEPAPPLPVALPRAPFLVGLVALVVVGVLGVLVLNTKINENSFRLDELNARQAALDLEEQQLSRELADLESPGSLRAAARRLGLVPAGTPAFINLPDGRVVGVPQPASGQPGTGATAGR